MDATGKGKQGDWNEVVQRRYGIRRRGRVVGGQGVTGGKVRNILMKKGQKLLKRMIKNVQGLLRTICMFLEKAMLKRSDSASWFNIATLFTGFAAFEVYRSLSLADAEYQGKNICIIFLLRLLLLYGL